MTRDGEWKLRRGSLPPTVISGIQEACQAGVQPSQVDANKGNDPQRGCQQFDTTDNFTDTLPLIGAAHLMGQPNFRIDS